jgi:hypothetical protein
VYGITFNVLNGVTFNITYFSARTPEYCIFQNCTFELSGHATSTPYFSIFHNSTFLNCNFNFGISQTYLPSIKTNLTQFYHKILRFFGCTFTSVSSTTQSIFTSESSPSYKTVIYIDGCDFSQCNRPFLNTSIFVYKSFVSNFFLVSRSSEASNNRIFYSTGGFLDSLGYYLSGSNKFLSTQYFSLGSIEDTNSIYRNNGATYDKINYYANKIISSNSVRFSSYFSFKLADFYTNTSTHKTFTVEFAQNNSATALTDYDLSLDVYYIDDTTSKAHRETTTKILPSSNNLSSSGVTWTGLTNPTKQKVSLTTSQTGSYGLCSVYVNIFVPSLTLYICPKVDIT